jgi:hypothetical protein
MFAISDSATKKLIDVCYFRFVMFSIFSQDALSSGQLLRLCFSRAVVKVWQAVKVWPLQGFGS